MNYYNEIKSKLIDNEIYSKVKDYSKERNRLITYYEVGRLLCEAGKHYGEGIIKGYSERLVAEVGRKYNLATLYRMRQLYIFFIEQKIAPSARLLSWSHYIELLSIKDENKQKYYLNISITQRLSRNDLRKKIKSKEYERLTIEAKNKIINNEEINIIESIKELIIIKNSNNYEVISEKVLQRIILENISSFLKELGNGFTFIDNEYKIRIGDNYNYIDLLLFNYEYNCFVVVELKVTELKKEHIGQIKFYMNYIDKNIRKIYHDKTIGIIIVKKNNKYVIEYSSDSRIVLREYKLI